MIRTAILTISDSCAQGTRADLSGQAIKEMLEDGDYELIEMATVPDDRQTIASMLRRYSDEQGVELVLTTGGTGLGPRDVTPEATEDVCERMAPGFSELLRSEGFKRTPNAILSRGVAGVRKGTLIVNLPGSPRGVRESLEIILSILPHAVQMMRGGGH
ncbi:MAG: MogA/MoaB family molybdenum cofactor biosynthesis protein [Phycisphaerales bacterium]|nr:MAG: MogA/MoaB family molybdenum cofactor biosynthesis protein [Phycisphaerales bacterium]